MTNIPQTKFVAKNVSSNFIKNILLGNNFDIEKYGTILADRYGFNFSRANANYPHDRFLQLLEFVRLVSYPNEPIEIGYEKLGLRGSMYFLNTPIGSIVKPLIAMSGMHNGLANFARSTQRQFPWGTHEIEKTSANSACYKIKNLEIPPSLILGMMRSGFEIRNKERPTFNIKINSSEDFEITIRW